MSWWGRHVTPRLVALGGETPAVVELRARACAGLNGTVVELGFGSGPNVSLYPSEVTEVIAVEPSDLAWRLSEQHRRSSAVPIRRGGLDGQRLDLPDSSIDCVLTSLTLCTIPDPALALREVRRVLRPGGTLHLLEHGLAPDAGVQRWQRRLEPLNQKVFDGCHLTRPIDELIEGSGLLVESMQSRYGPFPKAMRPTGYLYLGRARKT